MKIFDNLKEHDYEQLIFCHDSKSGLKAIICIHDTTLGPALGGCRIWNYDSEEDAIKDVLRLARGMTYKNAAAGLDLGGGKAVIIGDPATIKSKALFHSFGTYVNNLGGRYITAEDMNVTTDDVEYIHEVTAHVVGLADKSGNPAPITAFGVYQGMLAAVNEIYGSTDLKNKVVAVQGLGAVGHVICELLNEAGAKLYISDINSEKVNQAATEFNAVAVDPNEIYSIDCDIFAPCAMGAILNKDTVEKLKCKIVAGSANNQLADAEIGELLMKKRILYIPDYVINSGGVINVYEEMKGYNRENAMANAATIYDSVSEIIAITKNKKISTSKAADWLAEERIATKKNK